jgi:hypothetical protein
VTYINPFYNIDTGTAVEGVGSRRPLRRGREAVPGEVRFRDGRRQNGRRLLDVRVVVLQRADGLSRRRKRLLRRPEAAAAGGRWIADVGRHDGADLGHVTTNASESPESIFEKSK